MGWLGAITSFLKVLGKVLDLFASKVPSPLSQAKKRRQQFDRDLRDFQDTIDAARNAETEEERKANYDKASEKLMDVINNIKFARSLRSKKTDPKAD